MKKYLPIIAGIVLGLLFVMSAVVVLFNLVKMPPPPEGTPAAMFFGAFGPTGYLTFVKVFELLGGILNIQHSWMLHVIILCALYLLWVARKQFLGLLNR
jgi:putative oxidoreductase